MRLRHFEALRPVCPVCRDPDAGREHPLRVSAAFRTEAETIVEGMIVCTNAACQREYPIIDGVPLLVPAIRSLVSEGLLGLLARTDLSPAVESLIGDCCGPGSPFDALRQHLSSYAWDHYAEFDPEESGVADGAPGAVGRLVRLGLEVARPIPNGPILDAGCSVGRASFELAEATGVLVLGVDLNLSMLRLAAEALRTGVVRYPRRRVGVVYDRRMFPVPFANRPNVDFWACDAQNLPFPQGTFAAALSLNVLDSINAPIDHLRALARALAPGGRAVLACPYDWSPSATPLEAWLGGHSQRGPQAGASEPVLRALLTPGGHPWSVAGLRLVDERADVPWHVRLHDRAAMTYRLHLAVAEGTRA